MHKGFIQDGPTLNPSIQPWHRQCHCQAINNMMGTLGKRRDKKDALRMVLGNAAAAQGDSAGALQHIRYVAANHPHSPLVWNAYARAAACSGSMRSATRYLLGMVKKHRDSVPLMVLLGNSHMMTVSTAHLSVELFRHPESGRKNLQTLHAPRALQQQLGALLLAHILLSVVAAGTSRCPRTFCVELHESQVGVAAVNIADAGQGHHGDQM